MMIIPRKHEEEKLNSFRNWIFVFGRRKTGKSFLVKNFTKWDEYFFIKRNRTILSEKEGELSYETFINILKRSLNEDRTVVIDEFHRLGEGFLDFLHFIDKKGKLIVISSTLFLSKKLLSGKSPILGLFAEMPIKIISLADTLKALKKINLDKKEYFENSILLREPIIIKYFDKESKARNVLSKVILSSINTVPAFVGEIFSEEEKTISAIYEGILRAIAVGKINSTEIANYIFSKGLIENNDASIVQQYLKNLIEFGIIKKIKVYNKNKFIFKHISPLIQLFYYCDEKYNISERDVTEKEIQRIIQEIMPKIVEDNVREFFATKFGFIEAVIEAKDYNINVCLLKFKKPEIVIEVNWKEKIEGKDLIKIEENLNKVKTNKKFLFVPDKTKIKVKKLNYKIIDIFDTKLS